MALIDLWREKVSGHNFNVGNLTAVDEKNYKPHNNPKRPNPVAGVVATTLVNIDEIERQYFQDQNIPTADTDVEMKSQSLINTNFGKTTYDGRSSIIEGSNDGTGYIHHFAGNIDGDYKPGFARGITGIGYDETAVKADYDTSGGTTGTTGATGTTGGDVSTDPANIQDSNADPLTFDDWKTSLGFEIQGITNLDDAYTNYVNNFGTGSGGAS